MRGALTVRLWVKVTVRGADECWPWTGSLNEQGYGKIKTAKRATALAHRLVYEQRRGPIPMGLCVLHSCDNPPCCNPKHLFLGTRADNNADRSRKGRSIVGADHHATKLTADEARDIRQSESTGRDLANQFGVSPQTVCDIRKRRHWRHVP